MLMNHHGFHCLNYPNIQHPMEIIKDHCENSDDFYIISLKGINIQALNDEMGNLKKSKKRNVDFSIVHATIWEKIKKNYIGELKAKGIYNLYISFSCNGLSLKKIYVHESETLFEVIQALFVNKMFAISVFNTMFDVRYNGKILDPMILFSWFGNEKKIILIVTRKTKIINNKSTVLESFSIGATEEAFRKESNRQIFNGKYERKKSEKIEISKEDIHFFNKMYSTQAEIHFHIKNKSETDITHVGSQAIETETKAESVENLNHNFNYNSSCSNLIRDDILNQECVGIINIGNTCYMNSSIQCLANCGVFSSFFIYFQEQFRRDANPFNELKNNKEYQKNHKIINEWTNLIVGLNNKTVTSPREFKVALGARNDMFIDFAEEDAAEFIGILLSYLHDGLSYKGKELNNSEDLAELKDRRNIPDSDQSEQKNNSFELNLGESSSEIAALKERRNILNKNTQDESSPFLELGLNLNDSSSEITLIDYSQNLDDVFNELINKEQSIISSLFYGLYTTFLQCTSCGHQKRKSDLMMIMPLSIPNEIRYHPSCFLIKLNGSLYEKVLANLSHDIYSLIEYVKNDYQLPKNTDILAVEYRKGDAISIIKGHILVKDIKNEIFLYEFDPCKKYFLVSFYYYSFYFFKKKLNLELLMEDTSQNKIYSRIKQFLNKTVSEAELMKGIYTSERPFKIVNGVFNLPILEIYIKDIDYLFGPNLPFINPIPNRNDLSLKDCIDYSFKPDKIDIFCEKCEDQRRFNMFSRVSNCSKYLIIHLKRFSFSKTQAKINTFIDFSLDNFFIDNCSYKLVGTINHIEIGLGYGHYVSYIRKGDEWYCCNDSIISKTAYPDKSTAYLLFYEKIDS